jgi:hypothetical protein
VNDEEGHGSIQQEDCQAVVGPNFQPIALRGLNELTNETSALDRFWRSTSPRRDDGT